MYRLEGARHVFGIRCDPIPFASVAVLVTALLPAACARPAPEAEETTSAVALEHIGTVGCGDCADERQVTPVALAILDDERIAVLDAYEPFVRVFDVAGGPQRSFGTKGQGPGQLGVPVPSMPYMPGMWLFGNELGGVTVLDVFPFTLEAFDAAGDFVDTTDSGLSMAAPTGQAFDPETRTYYRFAVASGPGGSGLGAPGIARCHFAREEAGCEDFVDPVPFLRQDEFPEVRLGVLVGAAAPDGSLVIANSASYDIWRLGDDGAIVMHTGRDLPLPLKSQAELEQAREFAARSGRPEREIDPYRAHIESYGLQVDGAGRIWVLTGRYNEDDSVLDVFAPDGTYLDEVVIDAAVRRTNTGITPFVARGDLLAATAQRPDGNQEIRVYRISAQ